MGASGDDVPGLHLQARVDERLVPPERRQRPQTAHEGSVAQELLRPAVLSRFHRGNSLPAGSTTQQCPLLVPCSTFLRLSASAPYPDLLLVKGLLETLAH